MLKYLLENHIYFFMYLAPTEINTLSQITHTCNQYFTNPIWYEIFIQQNNLQNISGQEVILTSPANSTATATSTSNLKSSISFVNNNRKNHVISIDNSIPTKKYHLFQYLNLVNHSKKT